MKKIVSNVLIVSIQLIVGGLFLFMLFSDSNENNKVVVVENVNLNKMADSVSELFVIEQANKVSVDETKLVDLITEEEAKKLAQEEEEKKAKEEEEAKKAQEEAERKAKEEEEAKKAQEAVSVGTNLTTGNRTYSLSGNFYDVVLYVVACEAGDNYTDALAVSSVIMNRADNVGNPYNVVIAPSQFSCWNRYLNGISQGILESDRNALNDALNGTRNNNFIYFNNSCGSNTGCTRFTNGGNYYW